MFEKFYLIFHTYVDIIYRVSHNPCPISSFALYEVIGQGMLDTLYLTKKPVIIGRLDEIDFISKRGFQ